MPTGLRDDGPGGVSAARATGDPRVRSERVDAKAPLEALRPIPCPSGRRWPSSHGLRREAATSEIGWLTRRVVDPACIASLGVIPERHDSNEDSGIRVGPGRCGDHHEAMTSRKRGFIDARPNDDWAIADDSDEAVGLRLAPAQWSVALQDAQQRAAGNRRELTHRRRESLRLEAVVSGWLQALRRVGQ